MQDLILDHYTVKVVDGSGKPIVSKSFPTRAKAEDFAGWYAKDGITATIEKTTIDKKAH